MQHSGKLRVYYFLLFALLLVTAVIWNNYSSLFRHVSDSVVEPHSFTQKACSQRDWIESDIRNKKFRVPVVFETKQSSIEDINSDTRGNVNVNEDSVSNGASSTEVQIQDIQARESIVDDRKVSPRQKEYSLQPRLTPQVDRNIGNHVFKYEKCVGKYEIEKDSVDTVDSSVNDVSYVTIASFERLFLLPIIAQRWNGPIVVTVYLKDDEVPAFERFLHNTTNSIICDDRIRILSYVAEKISFFYYNFPINILRNIGIHHTLTTHFILFDIDMWPSYHSYEVLKNIPSVLLDQPKVAIVMPAWFHSGWFIANGTLEEQVDSVKDRIPYTMKDLISCTKIKKCNIFKKNLFTHIYLPGPWITQQQEKNPPIIYKYVCWKNIYQEPYLMVRRNDSITRFHEGFINYGYNKISYVETLRLTGYSFYLASQMFAFDLPHRPSKFQQLHMYSKSSGNSQTNIYYMEKLKKRVNPDDVKVPICYHSRKRAIPIYTMEELMDSLYRCLFYQSFLIMCRSMNA